MKSRVILPMMFFFLLITLMGTEDAYSQRYEQRERTIAIGDIHGDGYALARILLDLHLMDANENWIGGKTHLIFLGDILDRGLSSRKALDLLIKIENNASNSGGLVTTVMGNHELMVVRGDLRYFARRDVKNYFDYAQNPDSLKGTIQNAFSSNTKYGKWIDQLPTMISVGNTLFTHAGVESWIMDHKIEKMNLLVTNWLRFFRGILPEPPAETKWTIGATGPLWTRKIANGEIEPAVYSEWLEKAGFERVIVGHSITKERVPVLKSEKYGEKLVMIDTAISSAIGGNLSAIEWIKGQPLKTLTFERPPPPPGYTEESLIFNDENGGDGIDTIQPPPPGG